MTIQVTKIATGEVVQEIEVKLTGIGDNYEIKRILFNTRPNYSRYDYNITIDGLPEGIYEGFKSEYGKHFDKLERVALDKILVE